MSKSTWHGLICPNEHQWDPAKDLDEGRVTGAACSQCSELPVLTPVFYWDLQPTWIIVVALIALTVFLSFMSDKILPGTVLSSMIAAGAWLWRWINRRKWKSQLELVARSLSGTSFSTLPANLRDTVSFFPSVNGYPARNCVSGFFLGTPFLVADFSRIIFPPAYKRVETVVIFLDPIPHLPDFDFELASELFYAEILHEGFWRWLGRPKTFTDKSFKSKLSGMYYRLSANNLDEAQHWVNRAFRETLRRYPGWSLQARRGLLLFYRHFRAYSPGGKPTLLALAWQLRELLQVARVESLAAEGKP